MVKLNLGGGLQKKAGYVNLDRKLGSEVYPLEYEDGTVDEIYASHVLEHFSHREAPHVLAHWVSKLKIGGKIRLAVPDFHWIIDNQTNRLAEAYLMGGQVDDDDYHKSIWTEKKLREVMTYAGLTGIERWTSDGTDCADLPVSLNLEGTRTVAQAQDPRSVHLGRVVAVMSVPRLGWNDAWGSIMEATRNDEFQIPVFRFTGAFWDQCIQRALHHAEQHGADWILTLDYDSIITSKDIKHLMTLAAMYPAGDAFIPVQIKRGAAGSFMFSSTDEKGELVRSMTLEELNVDVMPVDTGHFGCTLIRAAALKNLTLPWFHSQPDPNGHWYDGHVDADITFWRKFKEAGCVAYQANQVKIGHLQLMVTWPSNEWQIIQQHVGEWNENGKPENCRGAYESENAEGVGIKQSW